MDRGRIPAVLFCLEAFFVNPWNSEALFPVKERVGLTRGGWEPYTFWPLVSAYAGVGRAAPPERNGP